jgi:hypothetical protein
MDPEIAMPLSTNASHISMQDIAMLLSSGIVGAVSRTAVAPLERLRFLLQSASLMHEAVPHHRRGIRHGLRAMWRHDGM